MNNKDLFLQIQQHLILDEIPSIYLKEIINNEVLINTPFEFIVKLKDINRNSTYNYTSNALTHTLQVVDEAAKLRNKAQNKEAFMWAALLHDIGKLKLPIDQCTELVYENSYRIGAEMTKRLLRTISTNIQFNDNVINLIKYHRFSFYILKRLPYDGKTTYLIKHTNINDLALLALCNELSKEENSSKISKTRLLNNINKFLDIMSIRTKQSYAKINISF